MSDLGTLLIRVGITGTSQTKSGLKAVGDAAQGMGQQADTATGKVSALRSPLFDLVNAATMTSAAIGGLTAMLMAVSGVQLAAKYQAVEIGLKNILHSADAARKMMNQLVQMGAETPFDTSQLVGFSRTLLTTGSSAEQAVNQLRILSRVAESAGLGAGDVGEMVGMIGRMRISGPNAEEFGAMAARGINLAEIVANAGGPKFGGQNAPMLAARYLSAGTGGRAADLLFKGLEKSFPGGEHSLVNVMQNLGEAFRNILLPTGRLLLPVLGAVGIALTTVANWFGKLNEKLGGGAGLVLMLGALVRIKMLLIGAVIRAMQAIEGLTASLSALAVAAGGATATTGGAAALSAAGIFAWVKGILGRVFVPLMIAFGGLKLKEMFPKNYYAQLVGNLAIGGGVGFMVGGVPGMLVGLIGGAIKTMYDEAFGGNSAAEETARNTKAAADALQDIRGQLIGGGDRAHRAVGDIEVETTLARALARGIG